MKILKKGDFTSKMTALIAGAPESGKTFLASTLLQDETMLPALIVVMDGSEIVLKEFGDNPKFDVVRADTFEDIEDVLKVILSPSCKYKTLVWDNITAIHLHMMQEAAKERGIEVGVGKRNKFKYEPGDYGYARNAILYLVSSIIAEKSRFNIFFTCWATNYKDADNPKGNWEIDIAGRLANEVAGKLNLIGCLVKEVKANPSKQAEKITKYLLYTQATPQISWARNKLDLLPAVIENPKLPEIKKILVG